MANTDLIDRLASLSSLSKFPRKELEWLVTHGTLEVFKTGSVVAPKDKRIEMLWIILSGHVAIRVDRGAGPRRVMEWKTGDVGGLLPYSRMAKSPGDTYVEKTVELFGIHENHFPEMIHHCPIFTAHTVHVMLDRARSFNTSDLQDEKMISLGKLAAGLAHELNNPASATVRCAKLLLGSLEKADSASRALGAAGLTDVQINQIQEMLSSCMTKPVGTILTPIQQADREDEISEWLERHNIDSSYAEPLANTNITLDVLNELAGKIPEEKLDVTIQWIASGCIINLLTLDIERAANRIYDLVTAVKKFTYMDNLAGPEFVDVESGLRDTVSVLASKAKSKGASITLDIDKNLPRVHASGGELNQVWMNLIDNALDAIADSGNINISARKELDHVLVCIKDDGPGIPPDVMPHIFDPFYTTKPPGQGTGLGLEISRRLVRQHRGDIAAQSHPGQTEFYVNLLAEKASPKEVEHLNEDVSRK
jgi:signal transduction histidine kinase